MHTSAELYLRASRGDLRGVRPQVDALRAARSEESAAWAWALEGAAWFVDPSAGRLPDLGDVPRCGGEGEVRAILPVARAAWLRLDRSTLERCCERLRALEAQPASACWARVLEAWHGYLFGDPAGAAELAREGFAAASRIEDAAAVVEATAIGALAAIEAGDEAQGLAAARRGWRMAAAEKLWLAHMVAGLALARVRRMTGTPALAIRILEALGRMATPVWSSWIGWELAMAGGALRGPDDAEAGRAAEAVVQLHETLLGCDDRGPAAVARFGELVRLLRGICVPWAGDAEGLLPLMFVEAPCEPGPIAAWLAGETGACPLRFVGIARPAADSPAGRPGAPCVYIGEATRRRVLGAGVPSTARILPSEGAKPGRVEACISALALAGPRGLDKAALFRKIYGFEFRERIHEPTFRNLRYRARNHLDQAAEIAAEGDRYQLIPHQEFAVVDPRCDQPFEEIMLRFLAHASKPTARAAASSLGVSLRTVQSALHGLVEEGACRAERRGRQIVYVVEDTTFTDPTAARAR